MCKPRFAWTAPAPTAVFRGAGPLVLAAASPVLRRGGEDRVGRSFPGVGGGATRRPKCVIPRLEMFVSAGF
jgi:hypothetical protein